MLPVRHTVRFYSYLLLIGYDNGYKLQHIIILYLLTLLMVGGSLLTSIVTMIQVDRKRVIAYRYSYRFNGKYGW